MEQENTTPPPTLPSVFWERFKTPKAIGALVLVAFLLFSRLWDLGLKPIQHDESMFGYYSWLIYEKTPAFPSADFFSKEAWKRALAGYDYLPIMHGPFLEYFTAAVFYLGGEDSDYTMRLGCAISGLLMFLSLFFLRKDIGEGRAWLAILLLGICPTLTYVTRYIRPDLYVIYMYIAAIHAGWRYAQTLRPWRLAVFLLVGWFASMTHETYVIFYFFMITFGIGCWIHGCVHPEKYEDEAFRPKGGGWFTLPRPVMYAFVGVASLPLLYWLAALTSGKRYILTILGGLFVFALGEALAWAIRRYQDQSQPAIVRKVFPNKAIPFYRELRYALTYHWPVILLVCLVGIHITIAFHTSFYAFMKHTWGQVEAFKYWMNEHKGHRIKGEFHFHLLHLAIYEMPMLILFVVCIVGQMWASLPSPTRLLRRVLFVVWLAGSILILQFPATWTEAQGDELWNCMLDPKWYELLHMTRGIHLWMFIQCLFVVFVTGWNHLNNKRVFHALCDYWFIGSFLAYNYAGEKVPWVGSHIVVPMMLSCACYIWMIYEKHFLNRAATTPEAKAAAEQKKASMAQERISAAARRKARRENEKAGAFSFWAFLFTALKAAASAVPLIFTRHILTVLAAVSFVWTMYVWTLLCFVQPGSPMERHSYASSHTDFHEMMGMIIDECHEKYSGYDTPIMFGGEPGWPLNWTLRNFRNKYTFSISGTSPNDQSKGMYTPNTPRLSVNLHQPPGTPAEIVYVIMDNTMMDLWRPPPLFKPRYDWLKAPFRHYWTPEPLQWEKMKNFGLMFRSEESLKDKPELLADKKTFHKEWRKFLVAYFLRDEERTKNGEPDEWRSMDGYYAYFGRLRPQTAFSAPPPPPPAAPATP